jgi:hypothetical protein
MLVEDPAQEERTRAEARPATRDSHAGWGTPQLVALTLVLGAGVFSMAPLADPDVWWHLRTGQWILDNQRLPTEDPWSLTATGRQWVAHSWLAEVVMALLNNALGLKGVILFRAAGVTALLGVLAVQAFRRTTPGRALLVTTLAVLATRGGWGERPQLLSFLLLLVTAQLVRSALSGRRSIWWAVPLIYLWANVHGLWFLGPVLVAMGALGAAEHAGAGKRWLAARPFLTCSAVATLAAGLTPNGPVLLLQPLRVSGYAQFVSEWGPVDIHTVWGLGFFGMVVAFVLAYGRRTGPVSRYDLASVGLAIGLGLLYTRTVAPAAVLLTPLLAQALAADHPGKPRSFPRGFTRICVATLLVLGLGAGGVVLTQQPEFPPAAPVAATKALVAAADGEPRVLNEYAIGGWLLLFAPTARPAIDGRAEIYPASFVADYIGALKMSGDWQATIIPLRANVALLYHDTPLVNGLRDQLGWRVAYQDSTWLVLVPPTREGS